MTATVSDFSIDARRRTATREGPAGRELVLGRAAEQTIIRDLLRRARRGGGGVVLVEGEPGIGTSLLLRDATDEAAELGFSLVVAAADQLGLAIPLFPLRAALRDPFTGPGPDHPDATQWWMTEIRAHLEQRAAAAPVLVCLDDLQWASRATLAVLRALSRDLKRAPVALRGEGSGAQGGEFLCHVPSGMKQPQSPDLVAAQ